MGSTIIIDQTFLLDSEFKVIFDLFCSAYSYIDYSGVIYPTPHESSAFFYFLNKEKEIIQLVLCPEEQLKNEVVYTFDEKSRKENLPYFLKVKQYKLHQFIIDAKKYLQNESKDTDKIFIEKIKNMLKSK